MKSNKIRNLILYINFYFLSIHKQKIHLALQQIAKTINQMELLRLNAFYRNILFPNQHFHKSVKITLNF